MVRTPSTMIALGREAPHFTLPDATGHLVSLDDFSDAPALLLAFICNHCPYVKHLADEFAAFAREYQARGLAVVAINANDAEAYPEDRPEAMAQEAERRGYTFPYLFDEGQEVAKAYEAACTPDFFLYDGARRLAYRGQFDRSRPSTGVPVTGADLRAATDAVLVGESPSARQVPSMGCNIKWRAGNSPAYLG